MDNLVIRNLAANTFKYYKVNNKDFNKNAYLLYSEGKSNPAVADMILREEIRAGINKLQADNNRMLKELCTPSIDFPNEVEYFYFKNSQIKNKMCILTNCNKMKEANNTLMTNWLSKLALKAKTEYDEVYKNLYPRTYRIRQEILNKLFDTSDILKIYFK